MYAKKGIDYRGMEALHGPVFPFDQPPVHSLKGNAIRETVSLDGGASELLIEAVL